MCPTVNGMFGGGCRLASTPTSCEARRELDDRLMRTGDQIMPWNDARSAPCM